MESSAEIDAPRRSSLFIAGVLHKAFVDVNEEGAEAAAATVVRLPRENVGGSHTHPTVFRANRPFAFMIRDNRSGSILFLGRAVNPGE